MAIDTDTRKFSAMLIGLPWRGIGAIPSGALDEVEFYSLAYLYSEFAIQELIANLTVNGAFGAQFAGVATARASFSADIGAGTSDSSLSAMFGLVNDSVNASAVTATVSSAVAIMNAAAAIGETWAGHATTAASIAANVGLDDSFLAEISGALAGLLTERTDLAGDFLSQANAISQVIPQASLAAVIVAVCVSRADLGAGTFLSAEFRGQESYDPILPPAKATLRVVPRNRLFRS